MCDFNLRFWYDTAGGEARHPRPQNHVQTHCRSPQERCWLAPQVSPVHHQHCPGLFLTLLTFFMLALIFNFMFIPCEWRFPGFDCILCMNDGYWVLILLGIRVFLRALVLLVACLCDLKLNFQHFWYDFNFIFLFCFLELRLSFCIFICNLYCFCCINNSFLSLFSALWIILSAFFVIFDIDRVLFM